MRAAQAMEGEDFMNRSNFLSYNENKLLLIYYLLQDISSRNAVKLGKLNHFASIYSIRLLIFWLGLLLDLITFLELEVAAIARSVF